MSAVQVFFENTVGKVEIDRNEQFLLFPQCFLPFWRNFPRFHQIQNCPLQTFSVWKSIKFVVWETGSISVSVNFFPGIDDSDCDVSFLFDFWLMFRRWLCEKAASCFERILCKMLALETQGNHGYMDWLPWYNLNNVEKRRWTPCANQSTNGDKYTCRLLEINP